MYIDKYYPMINDVEGRNMAKILISLNDKVVAEQGLYGQRLFSGLVLVTVSFNTDEGAYSIMELDHSDGQFYEHDEVSGFVYEGLSPEASDLVKLREYVADKLAKVIGE